MDIKKLTGPEKAAVLLLTLGEQATAQVFQTLSDSEVREISRCMLAIDHIPTRVSEQILDEFAKAQKNKSGFFIRSNEFVKKAISSSGNEERAKKLMEQVSIGMEQLESGVRPLETIAMMDPRMVASLLGGEMPQTVAVILSTQRVDHAAKILSYFPEEAQSDIMFRIAKIDKVSPEVLGQIESALQQEIRVVAHKEQHQIGGIGRAVDIINHLGSGADRNILTNIEKTDRMLAENIRKQMFTFEDLAKIDGRTMQTLLREVNNNQLTMALKSASEDLKSKVFENISERAADMIQDDLEAMGPVRLSEVESIQQEIVKIALRLEEDGKIVLPGRGGQDALV
jgi:flagellar motor switch protein FliG